MFKISRMISAQHTQVIVNNLIRHQNIVYSYFKQTLMVQKCYAVKISLASFL